MNTRPPLPPLPPGPAHSQTLSKVTRCEHQYLERAQQLIQRELEEEVLEKLRKVKRNVMDPFSAVSFGAGSLELRKKYISMAAVEVVLEVFTNAADIFSSKLNKVRSPPGQGSFVLRPSGQWSRVKCSV